jgi:methyl-accepting chemotaxis protein
MTLVIQFSLGIVVMLWFSNLRVRTKFAGLIAVLALGLIVTGFAMQRLASKTLLNSRVQSLRVIVETGFDVANSLNQQVEAGKLTKPQAMDAFHERLLTMTFDKGNGYIFAYTMDGVVVSMPDPKLIGVNRYDLKLANGMMIVKDQIDGFKSGKQANVISLIYPKPGETVDSEKVIYSMEFKPWNIFIGTGLYMDDVQAELSHLTKSILVLFALIAALMTAASVAITANITRPLNRIKDVMKRLARGDLGTEGKDAGRKDEVGDMAKSVEVFRQNLIETIALRELQEQTKDSAEQDRKNVLRELGQNFERTVGGIVTNVSFAASDLERSANTLTATAARTNDLSARVASAAQEASGNVQSVSSASNEMTESVNEISRQVQESARIASEAVAQADRTNARVQELSQAAHRIGDVVDLINTIAGQTNLLALNATIEAARAGDAGRGFAVVASEVKSLAEQTAKATGEIAEQIKGIQSATADSVDDIRDIGNTIGRISEISSTIASAVEEQGAATQEIARSVDQASQGTAEVATNIVDVQQGSSETGTASSQVLLSAQALTVESERLKSEVSAFLNSLQAA